MEQKGFTLGPWGGNSGGKWDDGYFTGVREIIVEHADFILSITVVYDKQGRLFKAAKHGGGNPNIIGKTDEVSLTILEKL